MTITESITIRPYGADYGSLPGLYEPEQIKVCTNIVATVHQQGGLIVAQLFHGGNPKNEEEAMGRPPGWALQEPFMPADLTEEEVAGIVSDYGAGAQPAKAASFDGIEVHSGTGTMLCRFIHEGSNSRTDQFGGSLEKIVHFTSRS